MRVLIVGVPATGKSFLVKRMKKMKLAAVDADLGAGLVELADRHGKPPKHDGEGRVIWKHDVHNRFKLRKLGKLLKKNKDIYIFTYTVDGHPGKSNGVVGIRKRFDKVYYLWAPVKTIKHRLKTRTNNDFGKHPKDLEIVLWSKREWDKKAKKLKMRRINSTLPPEKIIKIITS